MCGPVAQGIYPRIPDTRVQAEAVVQYRVDEQCFTGHWAHFTSKQCQANTFKCFSRENTNIWRFVYIKQSILRESSPWLCIGIYFGRAWRQLDQKSLPALGKEVFWMESATLSNIKIQNVKLVKKTFRSEFKLFKGYISDIKLIKFSVKLFNDHARAFQSQQCKCASLSLARAMQKKLHGCVPCWWTVG